MLAGCSRPEADEHARVGQEIRRALGHIRPLEPRLTLDTGWAPCTAESQKSRTAAGCLDEDLIRTEIPAARCSPPAPRAGFFDLVRRLKPAASQQRSGVLATLPLFIDAGETNTLASIQALSNAGERPEDLADLSALYLHLAGITDRPDLILESLEASSKALEQRPRDSRALFNWALGLSRLNLAATAGRSWKSYLASAPADGWAAEARGHLDLAARPTYRQRWTSEVEPALRHAARIGDVEGLRAIVFRHRQRSREWAERDLLLEWATANGETADLALATAGLIGTALTESTGDRMLAEGVAAITSARETGQGVARLRTGHQELAAGIDDLYRNWQLARARDHFRRAQDALSASPFALWADLYLGLIAFYQGDYPRAERLLEDLAARADAKRYPALTGRRLWIEGLIAASTNHLADSVELYRRASTIFCAMGEEENLAAVHALSSEILNKLGRYEESWLHLYDALTRIDLIFDPIRHHAVLEVAILNLRRQGLSRAGLAFAEEHLHVARRTGSAQILHYAFMHRAHFRHALGDLRGAEADLAQAARAAGGLKDPSLRQRSIADFDLVSAEMRLATEPSRVIPLLNRAIQQYEGTQYAYLLPQAYDLRARAFLRLGELNLAEHDLAQQIDKYETSADEILKDVFRLSLLDQTAPAFDEMIELQATKLGRPLLALEYCERGRYRALLDARARASQALPAGKGPVPPTDFDPRLLQPGLPREAAILELSLLDDHLLSWVVTRAEIRMVVQKVRRQEIARQIRQLVDSLDSGRVPAASRDLYDLLVRPVEPYLGGASHLVVVPDKELFFVPFEVLVDRRKGHFFVEDWTVSYAPSAWLHLDLRSRLASTRRPPRDAVVAATGAQGSGGRYAPLPEAVAEARSVAALYPHGSLLANPTKERFLAALSRCRILHFSGHAVSNAGQPFASKLVLTDTSRERTDLYAYELYDQRLPHLKLVTLSACGTAEPAKPALGMAATLAGPFLAAGVPQVIGSQWQVEDVSTRRFFTAFHRRFAQGVGAAAALRSTKLEFLHSGDPSLASPRVWGAFVLVGG
jgi:CHAT domain-containing protein